LEYPSFIEKYYNSCCLSTWRGRHVVAVQAWPWPETASWLSGDEGEDSGHEPRKAAGTSRSSGDRLAMAAGHGHTVVFFDLSSSTASDRRP
jgi:hypothetical protein